MSGPHPVPAPSGGAPGEPAGAALRFVRDAVLRSYAQVFFSRSRVVGALLLGATLTAPELGAAGLAAVLLATGAAWLLGLAPAVLREGLFGYNALLVGLGGAAVLAPAPGAVALVAIAVVATVLATAAGRSALAAGGLPVLTWPFLGVFYLLLAATPFFATSLVPTPVPLSLGHGPIGGFWEGGLRSAGAIFFEPAVVAGALVLAAVAVHSRFALLVGGLGFALAWGVGRVAADGSDPLVVLALGLNMSFTAMAIGGVWFVPGVASVALALLAAAVCAALTLGLLPFLAMLGLPVLVLPFNVAVPLVLQATRQRVRDGAPKSVDFAIGTPEENLRYYRSRATRFGSRYVVRLAAPFSGRWTCTQAVDGPWTHRGPWRDALDFQVLDDEGRAHRGTGAVVSDYLCHRLPVLAVADGTVARVVDGVPDNPIGEVDTRDNWGNLVIVRHAPGLCSLVCHLAAGSIPVVEGQIVRRGELVGRCGNSGRSPVPHLHYQLQATAVVGAPTISLELHDVVTRGGPGGGGDVVERLHGTFLPAEGDAVRNLDAESPIAALPGPGEGDALALTSEDGRRETLRHEIDLLGRRLLRSEDRDAALYFDVAGGLFTVFDVVGDRRSATHVLRAALSRVPLELHAGLVWEDDLPLRELLPAALRWPFDVVAPFLPASGVRVRYRARAEGPFVHVEGRSVRATRDGRPRVRTQATIAAHRGVVVAALEVGARREAWAAEDAGRADAAGADRRGPAAQGCAGDARVPSRPTRQAGGVS